MFFHAGATIWSHRRGCPAYCLRPFALSIIRIAQKHGEQHTQCGSIQALPATSMSCFCADMTRDGYIPMIPV